MIRISLLSITLNSTQTLWMKSVHAMFVHEILSETGVMDSGTIIYTFQICNRGTTVTLGNALTQWAYSVLPHLCVHKEPKLLQHNPSAKFQSMHSIYITAGGFFTGPLQAMYFRDSLCYSCTFLIHYFSYQSSSKYYGFSHKINVHQNMQYLVHDQRRGRTKDVMQYTPYNVLGK